MSTINRTMDVGGNVTRALIPIVVSVAVLWTGAAATCTLVFTGTGEQRLAAANLDCSNVFPRIWFVPASEGEYGRYCFGTDKNQRIAEGGMNEKGLFIGVNALDNETGWKPDPELPDWETWEGWYESGVPDGILAKCATVDEAVAVFRGYNLLTLAHVKFLMADAGGSSAIVEWSEGKLAVVPRGAADHQVSTNFVTSAHLGGDPPCSRFRIAEQMMGDVPKGPSTVDGLRGLLSATHLEFQTPTVLSSICNLATGEIHVYYFHDFERVRIFNLNDEISSPRHGFLVRDLFEPQSYVAEVYESFNR